ncbi:branched-chain amino acid ABC transporter permease [Variovorax ureilyticus]|uniref:Branched-chain amino acid ABC transporter permease n=1 Tax=Variovorax ureilyticus TaxID=1836198 RepID=A0ABU8VK04_9BURK
MSSAIDHRRLSTPVILCLGLFVISASVALLGSDGLQRTATEMLIRVVTVVGLYIFIGHSGVMSFGHIAFMGVGAYGVAWTSMDPSLKQYVLTGLPGFLKHAALPWIPASLVSALLAALVALAVGSVILRLVGIAASIATFSLLAIFNVVYSNWDSVTAGTSSIVGIPTPVGLWEALGFACAAVAIAHAHAVSRHGLALRAVREEPVAARSCGVDAYWQLLVAFVLSAFVCGLSGALDAQYLGVVNPDAYYLGRTFVCLAMLVIGGVSSLSGAVTGAVVISALIEFLVRLEKGFSIGSYLLQAPNGTQEIMVGLAMIVTLILRPRGLLGRHEFGWRCAATNTQSPVAVPLVSPRSA